MERIKWRIIAIEVLKAALAVVLANLVSPAGAAVPYGVAGGLVLARSLFG